MNKTAFVFLLFSTTYSLAQIKDTVNLNKQRDNKSVRTLSLEQRNYKIDTNTTIRTDSRIQVITKNNDTSLSEIDVRERILNDIQQNLERKNKLIDATILTLNNRIGKLDSAFKTNSSPKDKIDKLGERVQILEAKQKAVEQNELNVYEANYQSAIINLVSMDREIKPLTLFYTTRDFFNSLSETGNPVNYAGFKIGFEKFKLYIENVKDENAIQKTVADIIDATGNGTSEIPIVGAYSELLFTGMADYINSIGHNKRDLKKQAEKMFAITTALSQFTTDKNHIETGWDAITESLEEMQNNYNEIINRNLQMIQINRTDLINNFTRQSDANKRYLYLTTLRKKAADYVVDLMKQDPKDWKETIHYQLMDVQTLKVRYGDITYRIKKHINKYNAIVLKYKKNKEIGDHISLLETKLNHLKTTFDDTFEPIQYLHAATQMYKVN